MTTQLIATVPSPLFYQPAPGEEYALRLYTEESFQNDSEPFKTIPLGEWPDFLTNPAYLLQVLESYGYDLGILLSADSATGYEVYQVADMGQIN